MAAIFLGIAGLWAFASISRLSGQSTARGVVVDIEVDSDSDGTTYRSVIEFQTDSGETVRFTSRLGTSSRADLGDPIDVLYDPADPRGATEKTFPNLWLFPMIFGGIGLAMTAGIVYSRRRRSDGSDGSANWDAAGHEGSETTDVLEPARTPSSPPRPRPAGRTAEFRRAEASMDSVGTIRYKIVAKDTAGQEFYSELLDEDPSVTIMGRGNEVDLVEGADGWVVHFDPDDE